MQSEYADGVHAVTADQDGSLVILTAYQDTVGRDGRRALVRRAARVRAGLRPGRTDVPDLPAADLTVDTTSDPSLETVIHAIRASLEASIHSEVAP